MLRAGHPSSPVILSRPAVALVLMFCAGAVAAQHSPPESGAELIYDGRSPEPLQPPRLIRGLAGKLVEAAFGSGTTLNEAEITGFAQGQFTGSGGAQTAYSVRSVANPDSVAAVVIDNGASLRAIALPAGLAVLRSLDLEGDGRDELLLIGEHYHMAQTLSWLLVVSVGEDRLEEQQRFDAVRVDPCEDLGLNSSVQAKVLSWVREQPPRFIEQNYRAACDAAGTPPVSAFVSDAATP